MPGPQTRDVPILLLVCAKHHVLLLPPLSRASGAPATPTAATGQEALQGAVAHGLSPPLKVPGTSFSHTTHPPTILFRVSFTSGRRVGGKPQPLSTHRTTVMEGTGCQEPQKAPTWFIHRPQLGMKPQPHITHGTMKLSCLQVQLPVGCHYTTLSHQSPHHLRPRSCHVAPQAKPVAHI